MKRYGVDKDIDMCNLPFAIFFDTLLFDIFENLLFDIFAALLFALGNFGTRILGLLVGEPVSDAGCCAGLLVGVSVTCFEEGELVGAVVGPGV